ncbi:unnamed protein product [Brachionus calyciflorus]|uniref:Uncharacterized protein n=1 Tax=Brachionus calyciflorus TaxID=104777 RepID=A0A814LJ49_9BILA|nr:unnamed protein product [Brachionus calyciflorus]
MWIEEKTGGSLKSPLFEVAALIPNDEANKVSNELIVHCKDGTIKHVDEKYGYSDPLHVLMLPRGEQGW